MLSFSALQSLVREWWKRNCGSEVPGWLRALLNAAALFLQMSFCTGLLIVPFSLTRAQLSDPVSAPIIQGYEITIIAMAYLSANFLIGVKLLGAICHGPEVTRLVERATDAEVRYDAAHSPWDNLP